MSAYVLVASLVLLGQVGAGGSRYDLGGTNPFAPGNSAGTAAGNNSTGPSGGSDLVPIIGGQSDVSPAPGTGSAASPARPYSPPATASPASGSGSAYPTGGGVSNPFAPSAPAAPSAGSNPWQTNPPASGGTATTSGGVKPSSIMRAMLAAPANSRLSGSRLTLADAVASTTSRVEQAERVEAYWDLCSSVADYYLSLREQEELRRLRARLPRAGQAWQQAESELATRVSTSHTAAVASQYRLASLIGSGTGTLPLPADIPHCADYFPHYEQIFAGRPAMEAQELVTLLPLRFAELKDATAAVTRAEEWLGTTAARSDATDGVETLRALELLALRRRAFVQIARDYNRRICRYSELASPGQVGAVRLVSMLISRPGASTATREVAPIVPYNRQSQVAPSLPATFNGEGWTPASEGEIGDAELDNAIRQASGEMSDDDAPQQERSLLVTPLSE